METYNNDYTKNEDSMLWEIHEIRHSLQEKFAAKTVKEINTEAKAIFEEWKKQRSIQLQPK
jgi:hypothetical protein